MNAAAGIDVSGFAAHVVVLDEGMKIAAAEMWSVDDLDHLADRLARSCDVVAIDSPDRWSTGIIPEHADLSPKFVAARCAEFALARDYRYWVPWVTPVRTKGEAAPSYGWIRAGIRLFGLLRERRVQAIEVYPNSIFRHLNGGAQLPKKSTLTGAAARVGLLESVGVVESYLQMWSHDSLDSVAAAVTGLHYLEGAAVSATCGHDGSEMWLPRPPG